MDRSLVSCPWSRTPAQDGDQPIKGEEEGLRTQELKCISKTEAKKSGNSTHLRIQRWRLEAELMDVSVKWSFNLIPHSWELKVVLSLLIGDDFRVAWWS